MTSQELLNENKIGLEGIARLRNALYGDSVPALDVPELLRQHKELQREAYRLIGLRRVTSALALVLALVGCSTGLTPEQHLYYNQLGQSMIRTQPIYLAPAPPVQDPACYAMAQDDIYYRLYCR